MRKWGWWGDSSLGALPGQWEEAAGAPHLCPLPSRWVLSTASSSRQLVTSWWLVSGRSTGTVPPPRCFPRVQQPPSCGAWWWVTLISLIYRLGRWWRIKKAKNSICIIPLRQRDAAPSPKAPDGS